MSVCHFISSFKVPHVTDMHSPAILGKYLGIPYSKRGKGKCECHIRHPSVSSEDSGKVSLKLISNACTSSNMDV